MEFGFTIETGLKGTLGRVGVIRTPHGNIHTPAFMVVGTNAAVRGITIDEIKSRIQPEGILANAYHLYLDPGHKVAAHGGLAAMMGWNGPTMTDSGGFQVFSLGSAFGTSVTKVAKEGNNTLPEVNTQTPQKNFVKIDEEGVTFTSHRDGSKHRFTPEISMEIQRNIGADIIVAFDECTSSSAPLEYQRKAMERTHRWAQRSLDAHRAGGTWGTQGLYGVVQGGSFKNYGKRSARTLAVMDFNGYAIGGSFTKADIATAVHWVDSILPPEKPRHLLGIGEPEDIFLGVEEGIDTFDCVIPTRMGRHAQAFTKEGKRNLTNAAFRKDYTPIDTSCACSTCAFATKAYLAHLFRVDESLAGTLLSIHNVHFLVTLVRNIREHIINGTYTEYKKDFLGTYLTQ